MLPFGGDAERKLPVEFVPPVAFAPPAVSAPPAPPPKPEISIVESGKFRALGFFCGALTRGGELYADASAGAEAFAGFARLAEKPLIRAELHEIFAKACLDGAHVKHVREFDAFINQSSLADRDLALELTHALRIVLARQKRGAGFVYEFGTARSIAVFRHLLSLVRRAPEALATLASPEGNSFDLRAIEHRLLDERLDHADRAANGAPPGADPETFSPALNQEEADVAQQLGLPGALTVEALGRARRQYAATHHPDRAPPELRAAATQEIARFNAALDAITEKLKKSDPARA
jgi:hypothetical protein